MFDQETIHISENKLEEVNGQKYNKTYLIQKRPVHIRKKALDKLKNFKKFTKDRMEGIKKLKHGILFDGGAMENNVTKNLVRDKDIANTQKLANFGKGKGETEEKKKSDLERFGFDMNDRNYCSFRYSILLIY